MSTEPSVLPITTIQPSFVSVIKDVRDGVVPWEDIWVSCYPPDSKAEPGEAGGIHGKLRVVLDQVNRALVKFVHQSDGDAILEEISSDSIARAQYVVSSVKCGISRSKVYIPSRDYSDAYFSNPESPHRITAFDVSPDGSQYAMGFLNGTVALCPTGLGSNGSAHISTATKARPHKSTLTSLRFFPSSRVLLATSADFSLSILSASNAESDGSPLTAARTFTGHTRSLTSGLIIGVGKTVVSAGMDGTVRVWDVPGGKQAKIEWLDSAVTSLAQLDENTVFAATTTGVSRIDLRIPEGGHDKTPNEKVIQGGGSRLAYNLDNEQLAIGDSRGLVRVFDVRSLDEPLCTWRRGAAGSRGAIEELEWVQRGRLVVCTSDGLPYITSTGSDGKPTVDGEVIGPDCYTTRHAHVRDGGKEMWTAADDGIVRRYKLW